MKLALLGLDDQTLAIAHAAIASSRHQITQVADVSAQEGDRLASEAGVVPKLIDWESLSLGNQVDAVVVAAADLNDPERRADQLRKLVQAGVPLLVAHPAFDSMLVCYELAMIQQEAHGVLLPYLPWRLHPAVERLLQWLAAPGDSPLGAVNQLTLERSTAERTKPRVLAQFARDVDLIRDLYADVRRVAALGDPADPLTWRNLSVQMVGVDRNGGDEATNLAARWSLTDAAPGAVLTLFGQGGRAALSMHDDGPWQLQLLGDRPQTETFDDWNGATAALDELEQAIALADADKSRRQWNDASRAVELAESVERSLGRGRAIEVHDEDFTDIGTFKGTMTSVGCLMLLGILAVILAVALHFAFARVALTSWPTLLAAALILFLAMQLVLKLVEKPKDL